MSNTIVNGAPQFNPLGTKDVSTRPLVRQRESRPTHLPKIFFYARRGPTTDQLVGDGSLTALYHTDTFDYRKKWANHATVFVNGIKSKGNAVMAKRVIPTDAGPISNVLISLEVLELPDQPDYERELDGSIKLDGVTGNPIPTGTTHIGHEVRWVASHAATHIAADAFGAATITEGTLVDPNDALNKSSIYPILQLRETSIGEDGNLTGVRLWAPTVSSVGEKFDTRLLSRIKAYPFRLQLLRRSEGTGVVRPVEALDGSQSILGTWPTGKIDPATDAQLSIGEILLGKFNRVNHSLLPDVIGNVGNVHVYQSNINTLVAKFAAAEKAFITANPGIDVDTDFAMVAGEDHLFNFLGGTTYNGYPYHTYKIVAGVNGLRMGPQSAVDFAGGSDGTMSNAAFAALVEDEMAQYADRNSELMDDAYHIESVFYDSGFPLATKYKLLDFLAIRKDLAVALSTYEVGTPKRTASEDNATAVALRARAQLYPESDTFGTGVMRVYIQGRSGRLINSPYKERVPVLYEVATKCADYMGAANGVWKAGKNFTGYPGHMITELEDIDVVFTPVDQRVLDWDTGLNWVMRFGRTGYYIPAFKTVYEDDTSVLNSWATVLAICEINKVCQAVHRRYSGVDYLSNAELADRVDREIAADLEGRFDGRFFLQVQTTFTDLDVARNFSWTTAVRIGASGTKTVMTAYVEAYRREDLETQ